MTNEELERLAKAATPGPWADGPPAWFRGRQNPEDGKRPIQRPGHPGTFANIYGKENAAFIAAANPATILAILSERAELLDTVERMRGALGRLATATERLMAAWPDTHVPGRKLCVEVSEALNDAKARAKTTPNAGERG